MNPLLPLETRNCKTARSHALELTYRAAETVVLSPLGVCQRITSRHKPVTWLLRDDYKILKGPFPPPKHQTLELILLRREILAGVWQTRVTGPFEVLNAPNDKSARFVLMPHIARDHIEPEKLAWRNESILGIDAPMRLYEKTGQGFVELPDAIDTELATPTVLAQAAVHLMARYILDPIVGDAAVRNVLVVQAPEPYAVGIDYDDNRTGDEQKRRQEQAAGIEACLTGGKRWSRKNWAAIEAGLRQEEPIDAFFEKVAAGWPQVEQAIANSDYKKPVSVEAMKQRTKYLLGQLAQLWAADGEPAAKQPRLESQMSYNYRKSISHHGHPKDELLSAAQKYIRRGETAKAWYTACEIDRFEAIPQAKGLVTNYVNRLRVALGEDVGIAAPALPEVFDQYHEAWLAARAGGDEDRRREALFQMVRCLAQAPKLRLVSDVKAAFFAEETMRHALADEDLRQIYPAGCETYEQLHERYLARVDKASRAKGAALVGPGDPIWLEPVLSGIIYGLEYRNEDGYFWVGQLAQMTLQGREVAVRNRSKNPMSILLGLFEKYAAVDGEYKRNMKSNMAVCLKYYRHFGLKVGGKNTHRDWYTAVIWPASYFFGDFSWDVSCDHKEDIDARIIWASGGGATEFDDYVFDKHTAKGRQLGRGSVHFAAHGAAVNDEAGHLVNSHWRKLYNEWKQVQQSQEDAKKTTKKKRKRQ